MNLIMVPIATLVVCLSLGSTSHAYNILMMMPFSSKSHVLAFQPIADELARRGHDVVIVSSIKPPDERRPGIEYIHLRLAEDVFDKHQFSFFEGDFSEVRVRQIFLELLKDLAAVTYEEEFVRDLVRNPRDEKTGRPKHDVVIIDVVFNDFILPLAHHMGVPSMYFAPGLISPNVAFSLNIPFPLSYVSAVLIYSPGSMNFVQRAKNVFTTMMSCLYHSHMVEPFFEQVIGKHLPNSPSLSVLQSNVSFLLHNVIIPLARSAPSMPYSVDIGPVQCKPAQKLPQDFEDFMLSSGDAGVIYFSLGSYTKGAAMPQEMRDKVLEAFSRLPQKVLWKYERPIENLPKNIKLVKWAPQQDILGHLKTRLFITHGGGLSTQEAGYHGSPILGFPLSADQLGNVANAFTAGIAEHLDWKTFTADDLYSKINLMLDDKRYKENAMTTSALLRDRLVEPAVTASYWIEYVVRHRGARHLKSDAENLNFFQYFLLDIAGAIVVAFLLFVFVLIYTLKKVFGLFRTLSSTSTKKKQKSS